MENPIPLIDVKAQNTPLKAEIMAAIERCIESSSFILGSEVKNFEEEFQNYTKVNHAISCASGTEALLLPLMCAEIKAGDEVLLPSFTFYATAGSVARLGANPIFVDSDESYNICLKDLEKKITSRTKAIIPVHLFGQMADMEKICAMAATAKQKIYVLEDCAQSIGAEFKGVQAGAWGDYGAYSFYPTKNLGAMGDAGMMSTKHADCSERLQMIRVHGSKQRYYHELIGVNSRLDSIQAAVLRIKLRQLKKYEEARERIAQEYLKCFRDKNLAEVTLPIVGKDRKHVWNQFTIRAQKRDQLKAHLADLKIGSEIYYPLPMHKQKAFGVAGKVSLALCDQLENEVLSLPMYPELPLEATHRVVEAITGFFKK